MVATFAQLKLRLLRNSFRNNTQLKFSVAIMSMFGVAVLVGSTFGILHLRRAEPALIGAWTTIIFAILSVGWLVFPLLAGSTDATVDPSKLSHLPISDRDFTTGLLTASVIGIMPAFTVAFILLWALAAQSVTEVLYMGLAAIVLILMLVVTAQTGSAFMSGLVRGRKTRDVATALLALVAMTSGFTFQFVLDPLFDATAEQITTLSRWLRWLPGGWIGQGIGRARVGDWVPAFGALAAGLAYVTAVAVVWRRILRTLLTTTEERGGKGVDSNNFVPAFARGLPGDIAASLARSLKELRRDPRIWANLAAQLPLVLVMGLPLSQLESERLVLLVGSVGLYGGLLTANLFGFDGRSVWVDLLAASSMRSVLWGKSLAYAVVVLPIAVIVAVVLVIWKGGVIYLVGGASLILAGFGAVAFAMIRTSVTHAIPMPDKMNVFGGQTGQSASAGFGVLVAMLVGTLLAAPAAGLMAAVSFVSPWATLVVAPVVAGWGWFLWERGVTSAESAIKADPSGFLSSLTPKN